MKSKATVRNEETLLSAERQRSGKRLEKSEATRESLLKAAAEVVGEVGYANASIVLITQRAGVAQGTFYNYFESRQEILDALLPALGRNMLTYIKKGALGGHSFAELEERAFRGFFSFLLETPHFFRILNEAEHFAPQGHAQHFDNVSRQYIRFLKHSLDKGEFPSYQEEELETIVYILMSARAYLALRYGHGEGSTREPLPDAVAQTYMKLVRYGLEGVPPSDKDRTQK